MKRSIVRSRAYCGELAVGHLPGDFEKAIDSFVEGQSSHEKDLELLAELAGEGDVARSLAGMGRPSPG